MHVNFEYCFDNSNKDMTNSKPSLIDEIIQLKENHAKNKKKIKRFDHSIQ